MIIHFPKPSKCRRYLRYLLLALAFCYKDDSVTTLAQTTMDPTRAVSATDRRLINPTVNYQLASIIPLDHATGGQQALTYPTYPQQQPKSLKFTLIAGKYWKFNIKTNSLQASHKEKELRLHKNVSANNFIIDDDGWFQYNHQQQQLFAWPSLYTRPTTYYFVLLPSGLDFEADGENAVSNVDVVANIVVELIPPLYQAPILDVDRIIDYKFSLDHLHRHSAYPLLLNQIVSVFELLSRGNNSNVVSQTPSSKPTVNQFASHQSKQSRLSNKLNEYLLIDSSYSTDGELFSLTWTTHSSLVNNTIVPIKECRLASINDIVTKLSSPSLSYQNHDDKFVIYYTLEAPITLNSQSIVPTERGNYALKLSLSGPCKRRTISEELGLPSSLTNIYIGLDADVDDRENIVLDKRAPTRELYESTTTTLSPSLSPDAKETTTKTIVAVTQTSALDLITKTTTTTESPSADFSYPVETESGTAQRKQQADATTIDAVQSSASNTPASALTPGQTSSSPPTLVSDQSQLLTESLATKADTTTTTSTVAFAPTKVPAQLHEVVSTRVALDAQVLDLDETSSRKNNQHQSKTSHQAKSLAEFFETTEVKQTNPTMSTTITTTDAMPQDIGQESTSLTSIAKSNTSAPTHSHSNGPHESSLNEDLIGILNEVMEYLVSLAVPLSIIIGLILLTSILIALCSLYMKKRKSKQFEVSDRFRFRYGSERKGFLKNSSKPVILEADQKSLSMGGTPQHKPHRKTETDDKKKGTYLKMIPLKSGKRKGNNYTPGEGPDFFEVNMVHTAAAVDSRTVSDTSKSGAGARM